MKLDFNIEKLVEAGLSRQDAVAIVEKTPALAERLSAAELWSQISNAVLNPAVPFPAHLYLYETVFSAWDWTQGPPPAWIPTTADIDNSNIAAFQQKIGVESYDVLYNWSINKREDFWRLIVETLDITLKRRPRSTVNFEDGIESPTWLPGARINIAESCFNAPADATAVVYQAEGGELSSMTYGELDGLSYRVANSLVGAGMSPGDTIAIAMPMTVEAVAAYLGTVKAGCAVVSVADSFAPDEIAARLRIAGAKAVFTQDVVHRAGKTLPMYQKVVDAGAEKAIVVPTTDKLPLPLRDTDVEWSVFLTDDDSFEPHSCRPEDVINILFSSGTTGDPKAIPWTHTTPIKCAMDGCLHHDIKPGDLVAWPTNIGWMMGPWLIFASLINRGTMALYYGAPNTREFCEFVQNARVRMLGVVPSLVKAWRSSGSIDGLDWTSIKLFSSTGEASNAEDMLYLMSRAGYRPIVEYCGGTEIGGGYITGTVVQAASPATFSTPALGLALHIIDEEGKPADTGELFLEPPSMGLSDKLLNKDHHGVYYEGTPGGPNGERLRRHGDQMERLPGGYFRAQGRADDTMNLGGIKISAAEIERVISTVESISEAAAIAVPTEGGGPSRLVLYVVSEPGAELDVEVLIETMQRAITERLNPLFRIHDVVIIDALPRTASNKVMRRVLRDSYIK